MTEEEINWAMKYAQKAHEAVMSAHPGDVLAQASALVDAIIASPNAFRREFGQEPDPLELTAYVELCFYGLDHQIKGSKQ